MKSVRIGAERIVRRLAQQGHAEWDEDLVKILVDDRARKAPFVRSSVPPAQVAEAAALIRRAKRPALVCGGGVHGADATAEVAAFARKFGGLVVLRSPGRDRWPRQSPMRRACSIRSVPGRRAS